MGDTKVMAPFILNPGTRWDERSATGLRPH